jgi:serine/threonine-protein kinase
MVFTSDGHTTLRALDAATGEEKWAFPTDNKIWSTPVVQSGVVYFGSLDHHVYALDAASGAKKWEFTAGGAIPGTPLVTRDTVYIGAGDRKLYALDAATGEKKWEFVGRNWFWTQPVLHNGVIYANELGRPGNFGGPGDHPVYALDAATGKEVWAAPFQAPKLVLAPPVISGDLLTVTTEDGSVISIDAATGQQRASGRVEPSTALHGNVASVNGTALVPGVDNVLYAVDMASGRTIWTFKAS